MVHLTLLEGNLHSAPLPADCSDICPFMSLRSPRCFFLSYCCHAWSVLVCVSQSVCVLLIMRKFKTYCLGKYFFYFVSRESRGHNIKPDLSDLLFPTYQVQILDLKGQRREPAVTCSRRMGKVIGEWLESPQVTSNSHFTPMGNSCGAESLTSTVKTKQLSRCLMNARALIKTRSRQTGRGGGESSPLNRSAVVFQTPSLLFQLLF